AVALLDDGDALVAAPAAVVGGVPAAGCVYRFAASGKLGRTFAAPLPQPYEIFGTAFVSVGADLLVGAPQATVDDRVHAGAAYLLETASGAQRRRYLNPVPAADDL